MGNLNQINTRWDIHKLGFFLVILNAILLSVWAIKHTVALRNCLLGLGLILSIAYVMMDWRQGSLRRQLSFPNNLPFILIGLIFVWVLVHFFLFSQDPELQLHELRSTWLRAFLGSIIAFSSGLAISKRPPLINYLWVGLLTSILAVIPRYLTKAIALNTPFAPDYFGYIFYGKIYAVLIGTILISGLSGTLWDQIRRSGISASLRQGMFWLLGVSVSLYAYVYIFDARNGIGLAAILFCGLILFGSIWWVQHIQRNKSISGAKAITASVLGLLLLGGIFWNQQAKYNPGWSHLIEDAKIGVQIDRYPEWQSSNLTGVYPKTDLGQQVTGTNYERVAWAVVGLKLLAQHPFGQGSLYGPFARLLQVEYPKATAISTHSGWIDLGLALGIPGLVLMWGVLISTIWLCIRNHGPLMMTGLVMTISLFFLYAVGELSNSHSVEILFYWLSMSAALQLSRGVAVNKVT